MGAVGDVDGPTEATLQFLRERRAHFRREGGSIRFPPYSRAQEREWVEEARRYFDDIKRLEKSRQTERLRWGHKSLIVAVQQALCLVAVLRGELVAALSYTVRKECIWSGYLGSRQADIAQKGGTALELALATVAVKAGVGIRGTYVPAAVRSYHLLIGRRVDQPAVRDSEWTAEDCRLIVEECGAVLD